MIQKKKKKRHGYGYQSEVLEEERGIFQPGRQRVGPCLYQEEELPTLCTCRGVCRSGGGKKRNFPLVPSVFSEKGDEVIS